MIMTGLELKRIREKAGLTQKEFGDLVGKSARTIINWEQSENISQFTENIVKSVIDNYEAESETFSLEVPEPLEVFKTKAGSTYEELDNGKYLLTVPLIPVRALATYLSEYSDLDYIDELNKISFIVDRVGKGKYQAFEVKNDSMNDGTINSIPDGAIVLGRELGKQHWSNKLHIKGYPFWIIVHKDTILCKEIIDHNIEDGTIKCRSLNDSPEYSDFTLKLEDCLQLFNIVKKQI